MSQYQTAGYLYDDFGDGELHLRDRQAPADDNIGRQYRRYRPHWVVKDGSVSATDGKAEFPGDGNQNRIVKFSDVYNATWEWDIEYNSAPGGGDIFESRFIHNGVDNRLYWRMRLTGNNIYLTKDDGDATTDVISASVSPGTAQNTVRITRKHSGDWSVHFNDSLVGEATDDWLPSPRFRLLQLASASSVPINLHRIEIY